MDRAAGESPKSVQESPEPVQSLEPLPGRTEDATEKFLRLLGEMLKLVGAEVPLSSTAGRSWAHQARSLIREALRGRKELPEEYFDALLITAIYDPNPSFNRQFVEPACVVFGRRRVQTALLRWLQDGTNQERAGAARAWYWTLAPLSYRGGSKTPTPESKAEYDAVADLRAQWYETALREFVSNEHLDVRRCILPLLPLNPERYPPDLHELVAEAVRIARSHSDAYIRHRVEIQVR